MQLNAGNERNRLETTDLLYEAPVLRARMSAPRNGEDCGESVAIATRHYE
jgi:hypothetical protein